MMKKLKVVHLKIKGVVTGDIASSCHVWEVLLACRDFACKFHDHYSFILVPHQINLETLITIHKKKRKISQKMENASFLKQVKL